MRKETRNKLKEINDLFNLPYEDLQSFGSLSQGWEVGETRNLDGTLCKKTHQTDNLIRFFVTMAPNGSFKNHWHDCKERCKILSGGIKDDNIEMGRIWGLGENIIIDELVTHRPYNASSKEVAELIVEFYR